MPRFDFLVSPSVFEVIGLVMDPVFFSPLFFPIFFSIRGKIYEGYLSPPLLYSPVSNPCPLRDDSLIGLSVVFFSGFTDSSPLYSPVYNPCPLRDDSLDLSVDFFSGFMDSLLELGDLFVVFLFPY
jgi:hypothetical protein